MILNRKHRYADEYRFLGRYVAQKANVDNPENPE